MATEAKVAGHYTRGQLEETILRAMAQMGKDTAHLVAADLAPIDEFPVPWGAKRRDKLCLLCERLSQDAGRGGIPRGARAKPS
jgi:hypothetical protein